MLSSKQNGKKLPLAEGRPTLDKRIVMKPDWRTTFLNMEVGEELKLFRKIITPTLVRSHTSRLNSGERKYTVNVFDNEEYCIVKRVN